MEKITVQYGTLTFPAEYSETRIGKNNFDKTVLIAKNEQSTALFSGALRETFNFDSERLGDEEYILSDEVPQHFIFTNIPGKTNSAGDK
ncbi:hypothetical protein ACMGGR_16470 [Erwinia sp. BNK-24-b]|uniref:hypothetical protein n=1 Tax=Erwinia TaxID=551 RepID=UPI001FEED728|nr:hypothetical protein [Erwinia phyllosphaerae]MBV4365953.1 hypothetical protein [Erwinia phyllosphaerae]